MIPGMPAVLPAVFVLSTLLTAAFLLKASVQRRTVGLIILVWLALQGAVAASGFYTITDTVPPRFALALAPALIGIVLLFLTRNGRAWMDAADLRMLTWLHLVRVPVEIGLHMLYKQGLVPQLMTYEGINFDIISGATAPIIALFAFRKGGWNRPLLIGWNLLCLGLLINIVFHAVLSIPTPFQRFGFEQPNTGLLYFPYAWLAAFIVPAVLLAHLIALRRLLRRTGR